MGFRKLSIVMIALFPVLAGAEISRKVDELQITDGIVLFRAGGHTFRLDPNEADRLEGDDWFIRGDRIIIVSDGDEEVLVHAVEDRLTPLPRTERVRHRRLVDADRIEKGVTIRFHQEDAREVYIEGNFTGWNLRPMNREEDGWTYRKRLGNGDYRFRIRYRLPEDDYWFEEPEKEERLTGEREYFFTLEVEDREISIFVEEAEEHGFNAGLDADYNRVEGLRLAYSIGIEHGLRHTAKIDWSQAYSFAAERWSWEAGVRLPVPFLPGNAIEATGFDQIRRPLQWTVTPHENFAAAFLIKEDFYDYVWSRGWEVRLVENLGGHRLSAGYGERDDEAALKNTNWSLFGSKKDFRENLFAHEDGVAGEIHMADARYTWDSRNYENSPTMGWWLDLHGEYAGEELGGEYDYRRTVGDFRHYQKLTSRLCLDFRVMGGAIEGTPPVQEMFYLGGVGTLRGHRFKELTGKKFFLANIEYRASVWGDLECAFFADIGDAWDTETREEYDVESDMGIGIQNEEGDIRVDFARRLDRGADDDVVVTFRLARMF